MLSGVKRIKRERSRAWHNIYIFPKLHTVKIAILKARLLRRREVTKTIQERRLARHIRRHSSFQLHIEHTTYDLARQGSQN